MQQSIVLSGILHLIVLILVFCNYNLNNRKIVPAKPLMIEVVSSKQSANKAHDTQRMKTVIKNNNNTKKVAVDNDAIAVKKIKHRIKPKRKPQINKLITPKKPLRKHNSKQSPNLLKDLQKKDKKVNNNEDKNAKQDSSDGEALQINEIDIVRKQIIDEWNIPLGIKNIHKYQVTIAITMNPDRTVRSVKLKHSSNAMTDEYNVFANSVLNAITKFKYKPLLFPIAKYKQWKELELPFTPPLN